MSRDYSDVPSGMGVVETEDGGTRILDDLRIEKGWVSGVPVEYDGDRAVYEYFPAEALKVVAEVHEE